MTRLELAERSANQPALDRPAEKTTADPTLNDRIKPPSASMPGSQVHEIQASRGETVGFYQTPQLPAV